MSRFGGRKLAVENPGLLHELLPAIRGAVSSRAREGADRRHVRPRAGVRVLRAGRAARDGRRAVPGPPRAHQARAAVDRLRPRDRRRGGAARADRRARRRLPRRLPRLLRGQRRRGRRARATRTRGSCSSQGLGPGRHRAPRRSSRRSRATSITARSRSWRAPRRSASSCPWTPPRASRSSTGRSSSTSSRRRPAPGELQGKVALVTGGAGGIGRAIIDTLAAAGACVVAFDLDERRRGRGGRRATATAASPSPAT